MAYQIARELEARQIGKGDRVVIWGVNRPEYGIAFLAAGALSPFGVSLTRLPLTPSRIVALLDGRVPDR